MASDRSPCTPPSSPGDEKDNGLAAAGHIATIPDNSSGSTFSDELDAVLTWFSALDGSERAVALRAVARVPTTRHEMMPMIRILQDKQRRTLQSGGSRCGGRGGGDDDGERDDGVVEAKKPKNKQMPFPPLPRDHGGPEWLPRWLRAMRLHKYERCLSGLRPGDLPRLTEGDLERLGVDTVGARCKLLRAIRAGRSGDDDVASGQR